MSLSDQERTAVLNEIFNKVDLKSVNALLGTSSERFDELSGYISDCAGSDAKDIADSATSERPFATLSMLPDNLPSVTKRAAQELKDSARDSLADYENQKNKVEDINTELDNINTTIEEIQSKGTLTFTDEQELENLKSQKVRSRSSANSLIEKSSSKIASLESLIRLL